MPEGPPRNHDRIVTRRASMARLDEGDYYLHDEVNESIEDSNRSWYKEAVFYEVYVRAFCDANGDGFGDLRGVTTRLDYLANLGVNCIWLLPIYPSPLKDDGYDISDNVNIHPHYGNIEDFKTLVNAVHERNMKIIADLIPNHTSDQHEWFQKSRAQKENNPYREYYVWTDDPVKYKDARIIFTDTEKSNWTWDEVAGQYYWHRFFSSQPDLNFDSPKVQEEMLDIMRFWLRLGIDGFRVDAVPYLFEREGTNCENLPETHDYLKKMRTLIDVEFPGKILLAEACQLPIDVREYFGDGDEFHMGFHFPVMPRIYMTMKSGDYTKLKQILLDTPEIPKECQWVTFLRNHDELTLEMVSPDERKWMWEQYSPDPRMRINVGIRRRLAPLLDNDRRKIELIHSMLLTLPGSPILYYGDEIGMGDNIWLEDRNGVRTPMQWDPVDNHAGFSAAPKIYVPIINSELYNCQRVNVNDAIKDPSSFYNILRHMIAVRRKHPSFGLGKLEWLDSGDLSVASWFRFRGNDKMLVVSNLSGDSRKVVLDFPSKFRPRGVDFVTDVYTGFRLPLSNNGRKLEISLRPYQFFWLDVNPGESIACFHS